MEVKGSFVKKEEITRRRRIYIIVGVWHIGDEILKKYMVENKIPR
ncbi:MAG: hypothetical protein ACI33J_04380 [Clostridium sp.]